MKYKGIRKLNILARVLREAFYVLFDALGYLIFLPFWLGPKKEEVYKEKINKILIIRLDRIGDLILSTPAIRAVRRSFLRAKIHLLVREYTKDLVINNPNIDKLLVLKKDSVDQDYDLAIALHPGLKQNYLAFKSKAKYRIGYTGWGGGFFLTRRLKDDRSRRIRHEVESALRVVALVGCATENKRLEISITKQGEKKADDFFRKNKLSKDDLVAVIHPGARQDYIRWRKEGFARVADRLIEEKGLKIILIGSADEKNLVEEAASFMKKKALQAVGFRLTDLISLIKRCRLFIGNSTGPMHIASALGVRVVAIFGNTHPLDSYQEWGPWGEGHIVVSKNLDCPDCHPSDCREHKCMDLISSEDVFLAAVKQV